MAGQHVALLLLHLSRGLKVVVSFVRCFVLVLSRVVAVSVAGWCLGAAPGMLKLVEP